MGVVNRYATVLLDPPWRYPTEGWKGGADRHYPTLPVEAIRAMPVPDLLMPDAHVWMWTTDHHHEAALEILRSWGLTKRGAWVWEKLARRPLSYKEMMDAVTAGETVVYHDGRPYKLAWGNCYYGRSCNEFLILATRGKNITNPTARQVRKVIHAPIRDHSEKPEEAYALVASYSPGPRLECFARAPRAGFDAWGNQVVGAVSERGLDDWSVWAARTYPPKVRKSA